MTEGYEQLADIDMLEADPNNRTEALRNPRLLPFWIDSENKEMAGLWSKGYHYHIKRDGSTGQVTNCK
eukprot:1975910-Rhodomonas_salina.1